MITLQPLSAFRQFTIESMKLTNDIDIFIRTETAQWLEKR